MQQVLKLGITQSTPNSTNMKVQSSLANEKGKTNDL